MMTPPEIPSTMRAVLHDMSTGSLTVSSSIPVPNLADYQSTSLSSPFSSAEGEGGDRPYLIRISAISPTRGELTWPQFFPSLFADRPYPVPGYDLSGTVVAVGNVGSLPSPSAEGTKSENSYPRTFSPRFSPGDLIFARIPATRQGALAAYAVVREGEAAALHSSNSSSPSTDNKLASTSNLRMIKSYGAQIDIISGAASAMSMITAWQAIFVPRGLLQPPSFDDTGNNIEMIKSEKNKSKTIAVLGSGGGVGAFAIQLARAVGAGTTIAFVRGEQRVKYVREVLQADLVIDTSSSSLWENYTLPNIDLLLDCVGDPALVRRVMHHIRSPIGGKVVSIVRPPPSSIEEDEGNDKDNRNSHGKVEREFFVLTPDGKILAAVRDMVQRGLIKTPQIDEVFWGLESAPRAYKRVEQRGLNGKVVIRLD